jgi:segregation and condensation protein A
VLGALSDGGFHDFAALFNPTEGRIGIVVTVLAILELAKDLLLEIMQSEPLAPIYLKSLAV